MKKTKEITSRAFLAAIPFVAILVFWQLAHAWEWIPRWILKSPVEVAQTLFTLLANGVVTKALIASATNLVGAFACAVAFSLIMGILIGTYPTMRKIFQPLLSTVYPVPSLAWLPLLIFIFGFSRWAIWALIFISATFRLIFNVISGVRSIDEKILLAASNMEISGWQRLYKIIIPGAMPQITSGLRLSFGSAWRSLIGAEIIAVGVGGLGDFIWNAQWYFRFDQLIAGIIVIAIIGLVSEYALFARLEKRALLHWGLYTK